MKKLFTLLVLLFVSSFPQELEKLNSFSKDFIKAFQYRSIDTLLRLTPEIDVLKKMFPDELSGKSDEEIKTMLANGYTKLRGDFENILSEAEREKIELSKIEFVSVNVDTSELSRAQIIGCEVNYKIVERAGSFAIVVSIYENRFYIFEILRSVEVFD